MSDKIALEAKLDIALAYALAQLCKRLGWRDARDVSTSDEEAYQMLHACSELRDALLRAGIAVR